MKFALIGLFDPPFIIGVYDNRAQAKVAHTWQRKGGFSRDEFTVARATAQRGVFECEQTGTKYCPGHGPLTEAAFAELIVSIWGEERSAA
ncbi:hypothetical protein [Rhodobacter lacus]|uniref:Uncharacterized protein n=1 Tax=Rhodobacter lacus TaxID=1641972 RepID=A0ABW5ADN9_9RHOB